MLFSEVFFLLFFYLLDLLRIAAWSNSSLLPLASKAAEAKCDNEFQITQSNSSLLLGDKAMQTVVIILMSHTLWLLSGRTELTYISLIVISTLKNSNSY